MGLMNGITSPSLFCIFFLFGISSNLNSCYFYNMSNWEEVFNFMRAGLRDLDLNAVFLEEVLYISLVGQYMQIRPLCWICLVLAIYLWNRIIRFLEEVNSRFGKDEGWGRVLLKHPRGSSLEHKHHLYI